MSAVLTQDCEGTGTPAGWTDSVVSGSITWDETTVVGEGAQSLKIINVASIDATYGTFTAITSAWAHLMFRWGSLSGTTTVSRFTSGSSTRGRIDISGSGGLTVLNGAPSAAVTDAIPVNTWVHIWYRYMAGTGADGVAEVAWSTDTTRPTSGTKFATLSTGTNTTSVDRLYLGPAAAETQTIYFDQVIVDNAAYPDVSGGGIVSAAASAAGTSTAQAVGISTTAATGAASGIGTASGVASEQASAPENLFYRRRRR